jgi:hypothetical protein
MIWPFRRRRRRLAASREARLAPAEKRLADLTARASRVVPALEERRQRNHWGESIAAIARREPRT